MRNTTFIPSIEQCRRLMIPALEASLCSNTIAATGSSGIYSTPEYMSRTYKKIKIIITKIFIK
ncbi:hypothetical protein FD728_00700 [Pantoea sp. Aalb]|nr:hypothetical protein [Pantoea sp. Aalb]